MKLSKDRFDTWAASVWPEEKYSASQIPKLAGIARSSFYWQRGKDYVEASVVVALARGLGLNPLTELLKFEEFTVFSQKVEPAPAEVLSQVPPDFLMDELVGRCRHQKVEHYLMTMPEPYGLKRWLDTQEHLSGEYGRLSKAIGLSSFSSFSKKLQESRMTLGELVALCEAGQLNGRLGLVITGFLTFEEAGFPWNMRENVLAEARSQTVLEAMQDAMRYLEQILDVKEIEQSVYKHLG